MISLPDDEIFFTIDTNNLVDMDYRGLLDSFLSSFSHEDYYIVNSFSFKNFYWARSEGNQTYFRYKIIPKSIISIKLDIKSHLVDYSEDLILSSDEQFLFLGNVLNIYLGHSFETFTSCAYGYVSKIKIDSDEKYVYYIKALDDEKIPYIKSIDFFNVSEREYVRV